MLVSLFSIVSAQPPFQQSGEGTLIIEFQKFEYFEIGNSFRVNAHVYNQTGYPLKNDTVSCEFHAYNRNGTHAIETGMLFDGGYDFYYEIPAEAFTGGKASWIIQCNDSASGGFISGPAVITPSGFEFTISEAILYGFVFILIGLFLSFSIIGMKKAVSITWLIFYVCLTYIILYSLVGIIYLISYNYLWAVPIVGNIFYIIWLIMGVSLLPFIFIVSLYLMGQEAKATLEEGYVKQGYTRDEAKELAKKNKR